MQSRSLTLRLLTIVAILASPQIGRAHVNSDYLPPDWRDDPGTTFQEWSFATDTNPTPPDAPFDNPFGTPSATIDLGNPLLAGQHYDGINPDLSGVYGSELGWWDIADGDITITLPSTVSTPTTDLRLQVTYWQDVSQAPTISFSSPSAIQTPILTQLLEAGPIGGGWYVNVSDWQITGGVAQETITILANQQWGSQIGHVVIDSMTVIPEMPSWIHALILLAFLGVVSLARSRARTQAQPATDTLPLP